MKMNKTEPVPADSLSGPRSRAWSGVILVLAVFLGLAGALVYGVTGFIAEMYP